MEDQKRKRSDDNPGGATEDLVEQICSSMFFADFTIRNPKFKDGKGLEKEAADFLIPFRDTLIAFQVKSKEIIKEAETRDPVESGRIERMIQHGIAQLKTIKRAVANNNLKTVQSIRGFEIPFECSKFKKIIGVVILDLIGEEKLEHDQKTAVLGGFTFEHSMPVHVFTQYEFKSISTEIDTLPDFLEYLTIRESLRVSDRLSPLTDELDFLALYKSRNDHIQELLAGKFDMLFVDAGMWESFQTNKKDFEKRAELNRPSLLVDKIIDFYHSSVGYDAKQNLVPESRLASKPGTIESYWGMITELASIPRLARREIGKALLEKSQKADTTAGSGHKLFLFGENFKTGVVVLATNKERNQRQTGLYNLCSMAYCLKDLTKVIGIATEPFSAKLRSYDGIVMADVSFENHDELAKAGSKVFGQGNHGRIEEWKG